MMSSTTFRYDSFTSTLMMLPQLLHISLQQYHQVTFHDYGRQLVVIIIALPSSSAWSSRVIIVLFCSVQPVLMTNRHFHLISLTTLTPYCTYTYRRSILTAVTCLAILQIHKCMNMYSVNDTADAYVLETINNFEDSAAICTIQKGGLPYIDEWVDYNLAIGFEKIYIYDNSDDFELREWYDTKQQQNTTSKGTVVVKHFPGRAKQLSMIDDCGTSIKNARSHSWIAFIDYDEFIMLKKHTHILDLLHTVDKQKAGGLALNWLLFDFNDQLKYKPLPMTKRFTRSNPPINMHVKTIVRTDQFKGNEGSHAMRYIGNKTAVDTDGKQLGNPHWFNPGGPSDVAVIHHYWQKSIEEYSSRCKRGRASVTFEEDRKLDQLYCKDETVIFNHFNNSDSPTAFDDSAWVLLKERVPHYAKYDHGAE